MQADFTTHVGLRLEPVLRLGWDDAVYGAGSEHVRSQLIPFRAFCPDLIPLVFVHGTFSSPVTWAELNNSLIADPVLRNATRSGNSSTGAAIPP